MRIFRKSWSSFIQYAVVVPLIIFLTVYRDYMFPIRLPLFNQVLWTLGIYLMGYIFHKNSKRLKHFFILMGLGIAIWFVSGLAIQYTKQMYNVGWMVEGLSEEVVQPTQSLVSLQMAPVMQFIGWAMDHKFKNPGSDHIYNGNYEIIYFVIVSVLMLVVLKLLLKIKYFRILLVIPPAHFIWLWYDYVDIPMYLFQLYIIGSLSYISNEQMNIMVEKSPEFDTRHYDRGKMFLWSTLLSLVLIVLVSLTMIVLPIRKINQAIDPLIPNIWGARSAFEMGQFKMFSLGDTAFQSGNDVMGGPVENIDEITILFKLDLEEVPEGPIYLRANAKDYYTGTHWESRATTYESNYENYTSNKNNKALIEDNQNEKQTGVVTFMGMESLTILSPLGLYGTDLDPRKIYTSYDNEAFYKAGTFIKMLETYRYFSTGEDYSFFNQVDYLGVPDTVENEVRIKARQITEWIHDDEDKMTALTQYLISSFKYTLMPPEYTGERDFVSEFLLDTKEGYCTYFASSLVILARINGIPARYVEGFRVDPEEGMKSYLVKEGAAHAWAEVYINGKGWTIWEPTPPYSPIDPPLENIEGLSETSEIVYGPGSENTSSNLNLSIKEQMLEAQMQMGEDGIPSYDSEDTSLMEAENALEVLWVLKGLGLFLMVMILVYVIMNLSTGRNKKSHRAIVQNIYFLQTLEMLLNLDEPSDEIFSQILYDDPNRMTQDLLVSGSKRYQNRRSKFFETYKRRYGLVKYLLLRGFKMRYFYKRKLKKKT